MPVEEVAALLTRWRSATSVLDRGRVLAEGTRLLAGLDADERRIVARAIADEGAPHLADHLGRRTAGDVEPDEIRRITDGLLSLDRRQIDNLIASLTAPPTEPNGPRRDTRALPPPPLAPPVDQAEDLSGIAGLHAIALGRIPPDDPVLGDQALDHPGLGRADVDDPQVVDVSIHEVGLAQTPPSDAHGPTGRPEPSTGPGTSDTERPDDDPADADGSSTPTDAPPFGDVVSVEGDHLPALLAALHAATSATQRSALVADAQVRALDHAAALRVLDAIPEGWQRRRAAERLAAASVLAGVDVDALLARFPRSGDVRFVAGALVHHGALEPDDLRGRLPERDRVRLGNRRRR